MSLFGFTAPEWHQEALCAQVGGDWWFPEKGGQAKEAQQVCAKCPVQEECLQTALANHEPYGIWGSSSPRDRARMRRRVA